MCPRPSATRSRVWNTRTEARTRSKSPSTARRTRLRYTKRDERQRPARDSAQRKRSRGKMIQEPRCRTRCQDSDPATASRRGASARLGAAASARLGLLQGDPAAAGADLDEVQQVGERGPMRLHLADVHLHRARLFFREDRDEAREELKKARALIERCGYHRRDEELRDAEAVIT